MNLSAVFRRSNSRYCLETSVEMYRGFKSAFNADFRNVQPVVGEKFAGVAYSHVGDVLFQCLSCIVLEISAESRRVHRRIRGNLVKAYIVCIFLVDVRHDLFYLFVFEFCRYRVVVRLCRKIPFLYHGKRLQQAQEEDNLFHSFRFGNLFQQ